MLGPIIFFFQILKPTLVVLKKFWLKVEESRLKIGIFLLDLNSEVRPFGGVWTHQWLEIGQFWCQFYNIHKEDSVPRN